MSTDANPRVSVIVHCQNGWRYLRDAIDSVLAQTFRDYEIILFDNGSTDDSGKIAANYGNAVRMFRSEFPVSRGEARNLALTLAQGTFVAFLDSSDVWLPRKLDKQLARFSHAEVGAVYSDSFRTDAELEQRKRVSAQFDAPKGRVFRKLLEDFDIDVSSVVIRTSALDALEERFDPRFNVQDIRDLLTRLSRTCVIDYLDEPLSATRMHRDRVPEEHQRIAPAEQLMMLEKLDVLYRDFSVSFGVERQKLRAEAHFQLALGYLEQGKLDLARAEVEPCIKDDFRCRMVDMASRLPESLLPSALSVLRRLNSKARRRRPAANES